MAKIGGAAAVVEDIEEGEISDIEEISEETFKQEANKLVSKPKPKGGGGGGGVGDSRVWMGDRMKQQRRHSFSSNNYASSLHNFAWAQAVQNKPLNEILVEDLGSDEESSSMTKPSSNLLVSSSSEDSSNKSSNSSSKVVCTVIIDDSSSEEEGELEEGEIELDVEMMKADEVTSTDNSPPEIQIDRQVQLLREALETVNVEEAAEKSFEGACSQLWSYLESLQLMLMENHALDIDSLIQLSFAGIQAVNSVFCSMTLEEKEKNKVFLTRLLDYVESPDFDLFPTEQMKEIKAMMHSLRLGFSSEGGIDENKDILVNNEVNLIESETLGESSSPVQSMNSLKKITSEAISVNSGVQSNANMDSESLKPRLFSGPKGSRSFGPLFDLHGDHDIDSLPSPTRETPPPLPVPKSLVVGDTIVKLNLETNNVAEKTEKAMMHHYETDALKAVSTYQQKFSQTSCLLNNRLPSPTPSEESNGVAGDSNEEVSSSLTTGSVGIVCPSIAGHSAGPASTPHMGSSSGEKPDVAKTAGQLNSCLHPVLRVPAKHRDPRLRFAQPEVVPLDVNQQHSLSTPTNQITGGKVNTRKHNIAPKSPFNDRTLKRQRNGFTDIEVSRDAHLVSHGWLEEICTFDSLPVDRCQQKEHMGAGLGKPENGETGSANRHYPSTGIVNVSTGGDKLLTGPSTSTTTNTPSVPSLLKEMAVNPTMLVNLIMKQQSLAANSLQSSGDSAQIGTPRPTNSSMIQGTGPLLNVASSKSLDIEQKPTEISLVPAQTVPMNLMDEWGKVYMKPRDPRRILRISTFQQNESLGPEQFNTNGAHPLSTFPSKEIFPVRLQDDPVQSASLPSLSAPPPDISRQFTKRLKNVADILSTSQSANTHPSVTQPIALQVLPVKTDKAEVGYVGTDSNGQSQTCSTPEEVSTSSQSQNVWGDVEHLFKGYDEQQKAAIQRERARRIEEQNKMFAAQKLCLVLDLDHTLLNSAKFVEVEPVHQEMLRKKEEQDREKPQRHLFRLSHMGMWTKLRPGIWKFLEKASKLFELHLYTMGNKIYATEMAKVLDPTGVLFAGRVISKGDEGESLDGDERVPKIKDLDGVLGMESAVVIIDDSIRVWPHNRLNLIAVERYIYFPCSRRQLGLTGPSLLEIDRDERSEDGTLASSLAVIERIHQIFFSHQSLDDLDVRNILASEQRKILAGCRILFSRVFPVCLAKPQLHPLWQTAEQFGAVCTNKIDEQVTHVVANSLGTDKVNWALSTGRFVVYPGWVEASALLYRRANEHDFVVKP